MAKEVRKVFYDKDFVPKNIEELYCSGWKEYMLYHIKKYVLNDINHSPEDLLQDMMVQLVATRYIEKYDPEVCDEFTGYLHTFIRNFMSKPYNKEHKTVNGNNIINHCSLVSEVNDSVENTDLVSYDVCTKSNDDDFSDCLCLIQSIESDLAEVKSKSKVEYNGKIIDRTPLTVYKLLRAGYEIKEIATMFGTSKQFVYTLRKKIMDVVESM